MKEAFTKVPNNLIRTDKIDHYDKIVLITIMSCGAKGFPSYTKLAEWCGLSRDRVWKSIRSLDEKGLIWRFKGKGRRHHYYSRWHRDGSPHEDLRVRFDESIVRPTDHSIVRQTDYHSPPHGPIQSAPRTINSPPGGLYKESLIKNQDKESLKPKILDLKKKLGRI